MQGTKEVEKVITFLKEQMLVKEIRFPATSSIGIKPVSIEGTERIVRASMYYAIANKRKSLTIVHKGNIMKFTEGKFKDWGYELVKREYGGEDYEGGPWQVVDNNGTQLIIKDVIADAFLQQILLRPSEYDVIVTLNLNGVVKGPLIAIKYSRMLSSVSSGSQEPTFSLDFLPAKTSFHTIFFSPS